MEVGLSATVLLGIMSMHGDRSPGQPRPKKMPLGIQDQGWALMGVRLEGPVGKGRESRAQRDTWNRAGRRPPSGTALIAEANTVQSVPNVACQVLP